MNEQLLQAVAALIEKSIKAFEAGADFMAAEIPDVVHQLLLWHGVRSAVECGLAILALIAVGLVLRQQWNYWTEQVPKWYAKDETEMRVENGVGPLAMFNLILLIPVIVAFHHLNIEWLQIWIAPKVWLIEYAARMVK